jgi:PAS domain S-box-containing protein
MHELHVHQVELEQQNEELRRTQDELASARDRFVDLFDFAPVGYLTLDRDGRVLEANLTMATALGVDRPSILGRPFVQFIAAPHADRWQRLKARAMRRGEAQRIELSLRQPGGDLIQAQLDCLRVERPQSGPQLRIALTDISQRQLAERNRRIASSSNDAHEAERRRVAYRLHEDLGQRLGALKMSLGLLPQPAQAANLQAITVAMNEQIDQALAIVRRMSADLHPLMLDNLGLGAALNWLVRDVTTRRGVRIALHLDDQPPLQESHDIAIYRLTEMALTALAREADANIQIEVLQRPQDVVLQLDSDRGHRRHARRAGAGPDPIESMRDQIHLLGGRLEFSEQPEGARRMTIVLPFAREKTA